MSKESETHQKTRREHDWNVLLEEEEAAFQKCCELDSKQMECSPEKAEAVRHWWSIVNGILWMFTRTRAQYDHELLPFPSFTLGRLANISEEISNGNIPTFVTDAKKGGRHRWRAERHHIAFAVFYVEAAKRKEIDDKSYNMTVRQAYNVTAKAVQEWVKDREQICVGVPYRHLSPEEIKAKMFECGKIYARIGRGAPAEN